MRNTIEFSEALDTIRTVLDGRRLPTEELAPREALGRVLAAPVHSRVELPPFNKSAMDGFAVMADDVCDSYQVIETVPAGKRPTKSLTPGTCTRIMTGAPVPDGAGRVVMVEHTSEEDGVMTILKPGGRTNICVKGEDVAIGQQILGSGTRLDAVAVANAVSCGVDSVTVRAQVMVAVITTGDEIVESFAELEPGKIIDTNGPMLEQLVAEEGFGLALRTRVRDDRDALRETIETAVEQADIVLLTGGVSVGDFDFVPVCLQDLGFTIHFDSVATKPGKPLTFATKEEKVVLGLPGNPVSVLVAFKLTVRHVAALLSGAPSPIRSIELPVGEEITRKRAERMSFVPARVRPDGVAELLPYHGSAHLHAYSRADGLLAIPLGVNRIAPGERVAFFPLGL